MFWLIYLLFCIAIGMGADNRYGRSGAAWFFLAVITTPLLAAAFLLASGPKKPEPTRAIAPPPLPAILPADATLEQAIEFVRTA